MTHLRERLDAAAVSWDGAHPHLLSSEQVAQGMESMRKAAMEWDNGSRIWTELVEAFFEAVGREKGWRC
jgi:hypothetical protein